MRRAAFLDRDGIINTDKGHVHCRERFQFVQGIFEVCRLLKDHGFLIVVVTNQAGIAKGYYTEQAFLELTDWMVSVFEDRGITIADVFYCPHHAVDGVGQYRTQCWCRKPRPGMILQAAKKHHVDLKRSILIGDQASDIAAARDGCVAKSILANSDRALLQQCRPDYWFRSVERLSDYLRQGIGNL